MLQVWASWNRDDLERWKDRVLEIQAATALFLSLFYKEIQWAQELFFEVFPLLGIIKHLGLFATI